MYPSNDKENKLTNSNIIALKGPSILCGISLVSIVFYVIYSLMTDLPLAGTLTYPIIIALPIQLFVHLYFSHAIKNNDSISIIRFDSRIEYHSDKVTQLLIKLDYFIGIQSYIYLVLLFAFRYITIKSISASNIVIVLYAIQLLCSLMYLNYHSINTIYVHEEDSKRAKLGWFLTFEYVFILLVSIIETLMLIRLNHIKSNNSPALIIGGILLFDVVIATICFYIEQSKIKKWNIDDASYKLGKPHLMCILLSMMCYLALMIINV